jgi:hypothetical protein
MWWLHEYAFVKKYQIVVTFPTNSDSSRQAGLHVPDAQVMLKPSDWGGARALVI